MNSDIINLMPEPVEDKREKIETKEPEPVVIRREAERDLFSWSAPARPFKRKNRQFYVKLYAIAGLIGLVLFLAEGIMPVVLLVSLLFLYFVMNTVEPEAIEYKITTRGIYMAKKLNEWQSLTRFWFSVRSETDLLTVETKTFPGRLEFVIPAEKKEEIKKHLLTFLPEEEAPTSYTDRATKWISKKISN